MPVSKLPCPSRSAGLSRLVVDSTTRPLYQPQTIFKPTLNHLPTNLRRPIPNFIPGLPFCLEFGLFRLHSRLKRFWVWPGAGGLLSASSPTKMRSVSMSQFHRSQCKDWVHVGISPKRLSTHHPPVTLKPQIPRNILNSMHRRPRVFLFLLIAW